jgi:hypothetical protein
MSDGLDALALRCIAAEDEVKRLTSRVETLEGHRSTWRRRAWHLEERMAEIHSFAMAREDLGYEDHGDEFRKIAQMIRDALPDGAALGNSNDSEKTT